MAHLDRADYAALFGPTAGDQIRLGDTDLWIEIEQDLTIGGEESVFGGGKSIRESMNQSSATSADGALDTVITNVVVLDHWGIVRADVGIRDGRIAGLGRSGNPDIADGVDPALVIGPGTDVISGEGAILTAGGFDSHVHFLSPSQITEALAAGLTTLGGGGTGPSEGSKATTVTPGAWHLAQAHRALDAFPVNLLLLGKGNTVSMRALEEQALAGAGGYKVHEDWGSTPAAIDAALRGAEEWGLQVALHADSLNEAGFVQDTVRAIAGRSISAFHVEGAGGGHAPDILTIAGLPHVLPGSTNPTLPHTVNTVAEHLDMLMVCHHLNPSVPEDLAFAESRIRATTIAAEDHLHDLGAISITSSDAQAMGRIGEVITRTWQVAHVMKAVRGELAGGLPADNFRARRYVAKYTINPAVSHGVDHEIGSVAVGKLADLVLWDPRFFGVRPSLVIKGGGIVVGALGDPNASIPTPQPVLLRPALYYGSGCYRSQTYVAPAALAAGLADELGLCRQLVAVRPTRGVGKADMVLNDALPRIDIDPETHRIEVDGTDHAGSRPRAAAGAAVLDVRRVERLPDHAAGRRPAAHRRSHPVWWGGARVPRRHGARRRPGLPDRAAADGDRAGGGHRCARPARVARRARGPAGGGDPAGRRLARPDPLRRAPRRRRPAGPQLPADGGGGVGPEPADRCRTAVVPSRRRRCQRRSRGSHPCRHRPPRGLRRRPDRPGRRPEAHPRRPGPQRRPGRRRPAGGRAAGAAGGRPHGAGLPPRPPPRSSSSGASSTATPKGGSSVPDLHPSPPAPGRALRLGVAGPVGTGKSSLIALLCRALGHELSLAVVTNDIYTDEDARFLRSAGVLDPERIRAVETGACPHTAIRDDVSQNLIAVEDLERDFAPVDVVLVESGGDNLTATFSPALVDAQFFVLDVAGGGDVARKGGPGIARADLLVVNKTDLAPYVGVDVAAMVHDAEHARGGRPVIALSRTDAASVAAVRAWVLETLTRFRAGHLVPGDPGPMAPHHHDGSERHGLAHQH